MRRRQFLDRLRLLPFAVFGGWIRKGNASGVPDEVSGATLQAVVDTFIPSDDDPGAVEAGVATELRERLRANRWHRIIYQRGLDLLDQIAHERHGVAFSGLTLSDRTTLLESLLTGPHAAGLQFFLRARSDVLDLFYTSPAGQRMLEYVPPANGYPDYAEPID
ncbi:MAG: gluconate 2-dehydrogenase subunit 3 family protein [Arenicellales bacterium]